MQPSFSKNTFSGHTYTKLASGSLILPNSTETLPKDICLLKRRNLIEKKYARIWQAVGEVLKQMMQSTPGSIQVRIQDLVKGGPQVLRPKVADVAKRSCASGASNLQPGSRAHLRVLEAFGFLMLKYAFSHILETLFL